MFALAIHWTDWFPFATHRRSSLVCRCRCHCRCGHCGLGKGRTKRTRPLRTARCRVRWRSWWAATGWPWSRRSWASSSTATSANWRCRPTTSTTASARCSYATAPSSSPTSSTPSSGWPGPTFLLLLPISIRSVFFLCVPVVVSPPVK